MDFPCKYSPPHLANKCVIWPEKSALALSLFAHVTLSHLILPWTIGRTVTLIMPQILFQGK